MTKTMNPLTLPTLSEFKEFLSYDPDTGLFTWIKNASAKTLKGQIAGTKNKDGYIRIHFKRRQEGSKKAGFMAHRLAWLFVFGKWPERQIDHINGIPDDNRIENLRDVSGSVNQQNKACHRSGKIVGVSYRKDKKKWCAKIGVNGKQKFVGYFNTEQEAHKAFLVQKAKNIVNSKCADKPF